MSKSSKNIGFIARGLTKSGVTRFIENVLGEFNKTDSISFYIFTDRKDYKERFKNLNIVYIKPSNRLYWDWVKLFFRLRKFKLDTIFYPKNIIPLSHFFFEAKKINIIHDLAYFDKKLHAYKFWDTVYMKLLMKLSCRISDKIISISNYTKKDIVNILKINPDKIEAIHLAVESGFGENSVNTEDVLKKFNIKTPYMFYCGYLSPRKNILRTLKAFNEIKDKISHNIYLAGGGSWGDKDIRNYISRHLNDRVFTIGYLTEDELVALYKSADLFLYPSLYEGFGLPILEAQACGCPVLTSNVTSCPEVAGKGAHIVNPYSISEIKSGILKIAKNPNYRLELAKKGKQNVRRFSWGKTANHYLELI